MGYIKGLLARLLTLALLSISAASSINGVSAADYPVIFYDARDLLPLGLAVRNGPGSVEPLSNKCYYYGDGGYNISFSDKFFQHFKSRGFSVQAVCLGLVSETHYDPETGRHLPTYIIIYKQEELVRNGEASEAGTLTEELPFDLPNCFKNGNPYSDCKFIFGRKTGKLLSKKETKIYGELGATLDRSAKVNRPVNLSDWGEVSQPGAPEYCGGIVEDENLARYSSIGFSVCSSALWRGYGYALDASGEAGPSASAEVVKAAVDGLSKPQMNVDELRGILGGARSEK